MILKVDRPADGVARITLNRPEKRNALSLVLREELADALEREAADDAIRCVVLTGAGTAFCSGMDVTQFGGDRPHKERIVATSTRLFSTLAQLPVPVVAAVNGPAVAGGFALACLCDVRIGSTTATFGFPEVGRHIPPSYAAARAALPAALARWLCLTGELLTAERAVFHGVVSSLHSPELVGPRAVDLAAAIAATPAARETRRRILLEAQTTWLPLLEDEERALREALLGS